MERFDVPRLGRTLEETVQMLYNHVSLMGKRLDYVLMNIDYSNLAGTFADDIRTASGKHNVFTTQPAPPYYAGDIWISNDNIKRCKTTRESGSYSASHWEVLCGTIAIIDAVQTITNKTLTAPVINTPDIIHKQTTHDYSGAAADWTLTSGESKAETLVVSNSNADTNIIAPTTAGRRYIVVNHTDYNVTIKKNGGAGVKIAAGAVVWVEYIGSDYIRLTPDAKEAEEEEEGL